jgi:hypothetical protein
MNTHHIPLSKLNSDCTLGISKVTPFCLGTAAPSRSLQRLQRACTRTNIVHPCPFVASTTSSSTTDKSKATSYMLACCARLLKQKVISFFARSRPNASTCSESLHFVGLAISACLFTSSPRPSCTADSSAALSATAPVRSLVHAWPFSAPLQPSLRLPFAATPLFIFCADLTFHHSIACPISHSPPKFPYAFLAALCPFWHICCLDTGFERLSLLCLPFWRYRWNHLILYFP